MTDPIADLLTRIRNAQKAGHPAVEAPFSNLKWQILEILQREGYILRLEKIEAAPGRPARIRLTLKYDGRQGAINSLARDSTPGHRRYCKAEDLPRVLNDYGVAIISTSQGLMTNKEARKRGVGGEVLCSVS